MSAKNVVIPMAGKGSRFLYAGCTKYKPFIEISGKPMIQHVVDMFPNEVGRYVITTKELLTPSEEQFLTHDLNCRIIYITSHNNGPGYSLYLALRNLPLSESFFIAYCDVIWKWDYISIDKELENIEGAIFTHRGFHPHLVGNNYSGFCLPKYNEPDYLDSYREKNSFTLNWMDEPVSIGVYFIKDGRKMASNIVQLVHEDNKVSNEFYPSLIFNYLIQQGVPIRLIDVNFFTHVGIPDQLRDYNYWNYSPVLGNDDQIDTNNYQKSVMMMAGEGTRMQGLSTTPKHLLPVDEDVMYEHVLKKFNANNNTVIVTREIEQSINSHGMPGNLNLDVYVLEKKTSSQFDTLIGSLPYIREQKNFFLLSCDAFGYYDREKFDIFLQEEQPDVVLFCFQPTLMHTKLPNQHSHISLNGHRVIEVDVKGIGGRGEFGLAGFFWVTNGSIFCSAVNLQRPENREMIIDDVFKYFVREGYHICGYSLDRYIHLGSPEEYQEYKYWSIRNN